MDVELADVELGKHLEEIGMYSSSVWATKIMLMAFVDVVPDVRVKQFLHKVLAESRAERTPVAKESLASTSRI